MSALGFGGHRSGDAEDQPTAVRLVHDAIDGGIAFFDNCWEYHRGKTEDRDDEGMHARARQDARHEDAGASLRRLQTDHLDLWQIHGVGFDNDPDLFIRAGDAAETLYQAKKDGKVRFTGFTGHRHPAIHLKMLRTGFHFDAVQMPLNVFGATFRSLGSSLCDAWLAAQRELRHGARHHGIPQRSAGVVGGRGPLRVVRADAGFFDRELFTFLEEAGSITSWWLASPNA